MSKIDVTTRDLFMRLGATSQSRSARADAVFRRLRIERHERIADALSRAAHRLDGSVLDDDDAVQTVRKKPRGRPAS